MRDLKEMKMKFADIAKLFKALSDENRLKLFAIIYEVTENCDCCKDGEWNDEACMKYLAEHLNITLPTISHHIKELVNAGLVVTEKKGRWVQCKINHERLSEVKEFFNTLKD